MTYDPFSRKLPRMDQLEKKMQVGPSRFAGGMVTVPEALKPMDILINARWDELPTTEEVEYIERKCGPVADTLAELAAIVREVNRGVQADLRDMPLETAAAVALREASRDAQAQLKHPRTHCFLLATEPGWSSVASLTRNTFKPVIRAIISARRLRETIEKIVGPEEAADFHYELIGFLDCNILRSLEQFLRYECDLAYDWKVTPEGVEKDAKKIAQRLESWHDYLLICTKRARAGLKPEITPAIEPPQATAKFMSATELADHYHIANEEALRSRLYRFRKKHKFDSQAFREVQNRGVREAQFLYNVERVTPILRDLKTKEASAKRPRRKKS